MVNQFTYLAVKDMVSSIEGPYNYELKQSDQRIGDDHTKGDCPPLLQNKHQPNPSDSCLCQYNLTTAVSL